MRELSFDELDHVSGAGRCGRGHRGGHGGGRRGRGCAPKREVCEKKDYDRPRPTNGFDGPKKGCLPPPPPPKCGRRRYVIA